MMYAQQWIWMEQIRAVGNDYPTGLETDSKGNFYVSGRVKSGATFGKGASQIYIPPIGGETDAYVAKYDANQNLVWAKTFGGVQPDWGHDLRVDEMGNIYNIGDFCDTSYFDSIKLISPGPSVVGDPFGAARNTYVVKMDSSGKVLWAKRIGGVELHSRGYDLEIDALGNVYVTGTAQGVVQFDTLTLGTANKNMGFVASFTTDGKLRWVVEFKSQYGCQVNDILIVQNKLYVTGGFRYTLSVDGQNFQGENQTWGDFFFTALTPDGGHIFTKTAIGQYSDAGTAITSYNDEIFVAGIFSKVLMFPEDTIYTRVTPLSTAEAHEHQNAFISVYSPEGTFKRIWTFGGKKSMTLEDIHVLNKHTLVFSGEYKDTVEFRGYTHISINKGFDAYAACYDIIGNEQWMITGGSTAEDHGYQIEPYFNNLLFSGSVYSFGAFGSLQAGTAGGYDGVILRLDLPSTVDFVLSPKDTICAALPVSVQLEAHLTGKADSLMWNINGNHEPSLDGKIGGSISLSTTGSVSVELKGKEGTLALSENKINIIHIGIPADLDLPEDTFYCDGKSIELASLQVFNHYLWNTGATSSNITVNQPGIYTLKVSDDNICFDTDSILVTSEPCLSSDNDLKYHFRLTAYPNPFVTDITLEAGEPIENVDIYNTAGSLVYSYAPNAYRCNIKVDFADNIYIARVKIAGCLHQLKLVKAASY
jgi:hypothetical protein